MLSCSLFVPKRAPPRLVLNLSVAGLHVPGLPTGRIVGMIRALNSIKTCYGLERGREV